MLHLNHAVPSRSLRLSLVYTCTHTHTHTLPSFSFFFESPVGSALDQAVEAGIISNQAPAGRRYSIYFGSSEITQTRSNP